MSNSLVTIEPDERARSDDDVVWMGAPYTDGGTDPSSVGLFGAEEEAEAYVESIDGGTGPDAKWTAWDEYDGRRLVGADGDCVGVVSPLETTTTAPVPPFERSVFESAVPTDSPIRDRLPFVHDRPAIERNDLPFAYFDLVLLSDRGHLRFRVGAAAGGESARYAAALDRYAERTVSAATSASDDRVVRNRIRDLADYVRVEDDGVSYGKPRYRLAKRLGDWGGETGRCARIELWLLFQLLLRSYPDHVSWEAGYEYHDDH